MANWIQASKSLSTAIREVSAYREERMAAFGMNRDNWKYITKKRVRQERLHECRMQVLSSAIEAMERAARL
jgi:hypothetical protein